MKKSKSEFSRYIGYLTKHKKGYIIHYLLSLIIRALFYLTPFLTKILIDEVLPQQSTGQLVKMILFLVLLLVILTILSIVDSYIISLITIKINISILNDIFNRITNSSIKSIKGKDIGTILTTIREDTDNVIYYLITITEKMPLTIFNIIYILGILFFINWKVVVFIIISFPLILLIQRFFGNILEKRVEKLKIVISNFIDYIQERLQNYKLINIFNKEKEEQQTFSTKANELGRTGLSVILIETLADASVVFLNSLNYILILLIGGYFVINQNLTIGELFAIVSYLTLISAPISNLAGIYRGIKQNIVSVKRVSRLMDSMKTIKEAKNPIVLPKVKGILTFRKVYFGYDKKPVLKGLSFQLDPGIVYGLVGPSGCGKSTIFNLAYRFYDPKYGKILIDGVDIQKIRLEDLRKHIAIADVEPILLRTSIKENIKYGRPDATTKEIIEAAKLANIHDHIMKLPKKYDTELGSNDMTFSEGQKQRISLARMILKDSQIMLFDESTASLDPESEKNIFYTIKELSKRNKTILIIAHRLSTIQSTEKIFVLGGGKIVEEGSYERLITRKGHFYKFFNEEFNRFDLFINNLTQELKKLPYSTLSIGCVKVINIHRHYKTPNRKVTLCALNLILELLQSFLDKNKINAIISMHHTDKSLFFILFPNMNNDSRLSVMKNLSSDLNNAFSYLNIYYNSFTLDKKIDIEPYKLLDRFFE